LGVIIFGGAAQNFSILQSFNAVPFVVLVELCLIKGKALGSEDGKALGSGICYEQRKEIEQNIY
jgi:hypothetical protein